MANSKKTILKKFSLNRVIWLLTLSDIFTWGVYMIIAGFVGLYLSQKLGFNPVEILGIGTAVFYFAKGTFQIPVGIITDRIKHDKDEILFLLIGNILMGMPYFFFPSIQSPLGYYILQFIIGLGAAMNLVNWRKIFASNLQKGNEGVDYGVYDTIMSYSMIFFSVLAGLTANLGESYFDLVMISVGSLMILSGVWVSMIFTTKRRAGSLKR